MLSLYNEQLEESVHPKCHFFDLTLGVNYLIVDLDQIYYDEDVDGVDCVGVQVKVY